MNSILKKLLKCSILTIAVSISNYTNAQISQPDSTKKHLINVSLGYDYNLISLNLGYAHYFPKYKTAPFIDFTQGSALLGTGNFRTQLGLQSWQGSFKAFNLKSTLAFVYSRSVNKAGNYDALGMNLAINPGVNFNRFGFGADFQFNPFFATHIKHSDLWRKTFSETKDGWYSLTANNLRTGVYASGFLNKEKNFELNIKGGYQTNGQYDKLLPKFYFILGLNKQF
jgi:hypothetical protein